MNQNFIITGISRVVLVGKNEYPKGKIRKRQRTKRVFYGKSQREPVSDWKQAWRKVEEVHSGADWVKSLTWKRKQSSLIRRRALNA